MKKFLLVSMLSLGACSWFKKDDADSGASSSSSSSSVESSSSSSVAACDRGVFHKGPHKDEASGKSCAAPGGFCESDSQCHSSAAKCPCVK